MRAIPIEVNGEIFPSARAAARYIVGMELMLGEIRKENTIAKELKRCWPKNGEHSWMMYERYTVKNGVMLGPGGAEGDVGKYATMEDKQNDNRSLRIRLCNGR